MELKVPRGLYTLVESGKFTQIQKFKQAPGENVESAFVERPHLSGFHSLPFSPWDLVFTCGEALWVQEGRQMTRMGLLHFSWPWTVTAVMEVFPAVGLLQGLLLKTWDLVPHDHTCLWLSQALGICSDQLQGHLPWLPYPNPHSLSIPFFFFKPVFFIGHIYVSIHLSLSFGLLY